MKIAIFLGAGASAAEHCPIQNQLFVEYFKSLTQKDYENEMNKELHKFFKVMFDIDTMNDDIEKVLFPTFEEVLGIIDLAEQRRESFKNFRLEIFNNRTDSIRILREYLILLMAKLLHKDDKTNNYYHKLLIDNLLKANVLKDITFISANYDIHIDNAIAKLYKQKNPIMLDYGVDFTNFEFRHGWKKPQHPSIKLYKIHGSLNWMYCPVCNSLTITPYEGGIMRLLDNINEAKCLACDEVTVPIIIPPTYFKNMTNVFISTVWNEVEKTLRKSDLLIFCGYSFSDADIHIKYMIKRVQTSRKKSPLKFMVFNSYEGKREESKKKEEDRYKRFLGEEVIFTDNSFEEFVNDPLRFINAVK